MALSQNCKLGVGVVLFLLVSLSAFASVAPPVDNTADYWSPTVNYTLPGHVVEFEPTETMYVSLQGPPGFSNIGYSPNVNPKFWALSVREAATPEPGTLLLVGSGILGLWARRKRRIS